MGSASSGDGGQWTGRGRGRSRGRVGAGGGGGEGVAVVRAGAIDRVVVLVDAEAAVEAVGSGVAVPPAGGAARRVVRARVREARGRAHAIDRVVVVVDAEIAVKAVGSGVAVSAVAAVGVGSARTVTGHTSGWRRRSRAAHGDRVCVHRLRKRDQVCRAGDGLSLATLFVLRGAVSGIIVGRTADEDPDHHASGIAGVAIRVLHLVGGEDATAAVAPKGCETIDGMPSEPHFFFVGSASLNTNRACEQKTLLVHMDFFPTPDVPL